MRAHLGLVALCPGLHGGPGAGEHVGACAGLPGSPEPALGPLQLQHDPQQHHHGLQLQRVVRHGRRGGVRDHVLRLEVGLALSRRCRVFFFFVFRGCRKPLFPLHPLLLRPIAAAPGTLPIACACSNDKKDWALARPMDCEERLVTQAKATKAANPATKVFTYRNLVKVRVCECAYVCMCYVCVCVCVHAPQPGQGLGRVYVCA